MSFTLDNCSGYVMGWQFSEAGHKHKEGGHLMLIGGLL